MHSSEAGEVWALLEGAGGGTLAALYSAVREPWLTRGLLHYHARTGSARALDALARAPDHHARLLLDALHEELAGERAARHLALAALAPLAARRPPWLHRLPAHPAARLLLRAARTEPAAPRLHALLALAAVCGAAPQHALPLLPELAECLLRALAPPPPAAAPHLAAAAHALFHALYAAAPAALLDALRHEYLQQPPPARDRLAAALPPLLRAATLHPQLVLGARAPRAADALIDCRYEAPPRAGPPRAAASPPAPPPSPPSPPPPGSGAAVSRAAAALRPPHEPWFALGERCGADSAPHTPLPADAAEPTGAGAGAAGAGGSPPEAAVEATPENTPAKESRAHFTFPAESGAVRALGGRLSQPPSPLRKESSPGLGGAAGAAGAGSGAGGGGHAGRLAHVMLDRAAAEGAAPARLPRGSPVQFGHAPPPAAARPEPRPARALLDLEDREVLELTARDAWPDAEAPPPAPRAVRRLLAGPTAAPAAAAPAPAWRRAASCPPVATRAARRDAEVQTVDTWPEPYEFIVEDFCHSHPPATDPEENNKSATSEEASVSPSARLDAYLARLYAGGAGAGAGAGEGAEALALTHAALMFERWRREAHAERNRRLLGRCRQARASEAMTAALSDRVRALCRELESVRARAAPPADPAPAPATPAEEHVARLERELAAERAGRERAEAMLKEAEGAAAAGAGELQRLRGEAWGWGRRVESLARAAAAAERRAEAVRRLKRELLLLAEREARLSAAAQAGLQKRVVSECGAPAAEAAAAAARSEAAGARAECALALARADAAAARAQELEQALAQRDAAAAELKRTARVSAEEHAARLDALQDKYRALMHVLRRMEARRLETLAGAGAGAGAAGTGGAGAASPQASPPASAPVELADCSRTRSLLDDEPAPAPTAAHTH